MKNARPRKALRHDRIRATLEANPALRVNQLAEELGVSTETIRRDLDELDRLGQLSRTYGGAVVTPHRFEPLLHVRLLLAIAERQAIARAALDLVAAEETLLLGGGATMLHFARALRETRRRITVITPVYPVALELAANPLIEILLLPGTFEAQERIVCGPETIRAVERYRAPLAMIGASGLSREGVSEALLGAGDVYSAMLRSAARSLVLADHGKFDRRALVLLTPWRPEMALVCDREPQGDLRDAIRQAGAGLHVAPSPQEHPAQEPACKARSAAR